MDSSSVNAETKQSRVRCCEALYPTLASQVTYLALFDTKVQLSMETEAVPDENTAPPEPALAVLREKFEYREAIDPPST